MGVYKKIQRVGPKSILDAHMPGVAKNKSNKKSYILIRLISEWNLSDLLERVSPTDAPCCAGPHCYPFATVDPNLNAAASPVVGTANELHRTKQFTALSSLTLIEWTNTCFLSFCYFDKQDPRGRNPIAGGQEKPRINKQVTKVV